MGTLTKRQHNVPAFHLRLWCVPGTDSVTCHDLMEHKAFDVIPDGILARRYFYEEDPSVPDNRVEKLLSQMEGQCSSHFQLLYNFPVVGMNSVNEKSHLVQLRQAFSDATCKAIKTFAAYQYLRVPGAIEQKRYELGLSHLPVEQRNDPLNAGRFVDSGIAYIHDRFQSLKLLILVSTGQDFITSDWPCFDFKDSESSPFLGEEIGKNPEVVAFLPLTPRLAAVMYPAHHSPENGSLQAPQVQVISSPDSIVRNQNTLVIQQADRFVVADREKEFIFKIASKRKKSRNA